MKKVLIFSTAYFPFIGGAEVALKGITDRINDFEFDLITAKIDSKLAKNEKVGNVNVYRVGFGSKLDKFFLPFLGIFLALKINKKNKYNLTWSMMASQASVLASFFKIIKRKVPLLLTIQEGDEEVHLKRYVFGNDFLYKVFIQPWHKLVFKKADFVQVISDDLKKRVKENKVKCPIEVVPNGVDIEYFSKDCSPEEIDKLKKELQKKNNDKFIVTTSRLVLKNAVDDVIRAMKFLPDNIKFLIIGDGPDKDDLEKLAKEEGVEGRIKFLGRIEHFDTLKYLCISDIFCRPSLSEGLGISFLEAMLAGLPTIATPVGGIPDFLQDNVTGFFCKVRDPQSIAEKVKYILDKNNEQVVKEVKHNAKELIKKRYDWKDVTRRMRDIFNKLSL